MFAYCENNPVNRVDPTGHSWKSFWNKVVTTINNAVSEIKNKIKSVINPKRKELTKQANSLPKTGDPGSSQTLYNPDGTPKQKRWYGPDGQAERDRDYNHSGNLPFPHDHAWEDGERCKEHLDPSPDYEFSLKPLIGIGVVAVSIVGIFLVATDDATIVGIADDFLFAPLGAGVSGGVAIIVG